MSRVNQIKPSTTAPPLWMLLKVTDLGDAVYDTRLNGAALPLDDCSIGRIRALEDSIGRRSDYDFVQNFSWRYPKKAFVQFEPQEIELMPSYIAVNVVYFECPPEDGHRGQCGIRLVFSCEKTAAWMVSPFC